MKSFLAITLALYGISAFAGYSSCKSEYRFYNYKLDRLIEYSICEGVGEEVEGWPQKLPADIKVLAFDALNPGRAIIMSSLMLRPDSQEYAFINNPTLSKEQVVGASKDFEDFINFWKVRGFEELSPTKLAPNKALSKSTQRAQWKFHEVYDLPDSSAKVGWRMGIWKGKVQEPLVIFAVSASGKEIPLFDHSSPPSWTFTGSRSSEFFLDPKKKFLILKFGDTWDGTYFIKLDKFPQIFSK